MGVSIESYRSAIGMHDCFVKTKENKLLLCLLKLVRDLFKYFGPILLMLFINMPYLYCVLLLILLQCGDIEVNPGPPPPQLTKLCHINARSLLAGANPELHLDSQDTLLDDIYETLVFDHSFDIIGIGETWLKPTTVIETLNMTGYHTPLVKSRFDRGGGVMLYVRSEFVVERRLDLEVDDIELLWAEVKIGKQKILVGIGYRSPGMSAAQVDDFLNSFAQSYEHTLNEQSDAIIIMGDFNDRCKHWDDGHTDSELGLKFYSYLKDSNLYQLINEPTRLNSLLDLLITDSPGFIEDFGTLSQIGDIDHRIIHGTLRIHNPLPAKLHRTVLHYNKADWDKINRDLSNAPWDLAFTLFTDTNDIL